MEDETRLSPGGAPAAPTSADGWLSSSGSIDHGRFAPGMVLDGRYRIIGLLGRGGMGEVYRADDLRLGQPVALKFLPESLARDPIRLAQFHNEVRTARQVSHANVCRVYDIGEIPAASGTASGQLFLTMEYVDGEDLSSLLRRIGRLPEDKALEIARQLCAGLAAAHERGVLHRDLKPANVMLDGAGRVRIMDFSLAAIGAVTDVRAGTPAYMAPEQLDGKEVTSRSDVFALGLLLYELFTGKRVFDAKTIGDLVQQHASGTITPPMEIVRTLDPTVERAILRCLNPDPARRPASALAVAAALPGGDPLAAALAAGETPSPEMVAAVGGESATLSPVAGIAWLGAAALLLIAVASLADRTSLLTRVPFRKPAAVLLDRADEIRRSLGYTNTPVDQSSGFTYDTDYLNWGEAHGSGDGQWKDLAEGRPAGMLFRLRTSPVSLVPLNRLELVDERDPPLTMAGSTVIKVDLRGRLMSFVAVPPEVETPPATSPTDWRPLFTAAALDKGAFAEITPLRTPATYADERRAWQGVLPGTTTAVTIQAAAYRGRPIDFQIVGPWTSAGRDPGPESQADRLESRQSVLILALLAAAAVLARRNIRSGRADRRAAFRLGTGLAGAFTLFWILLPHMSRISDDTDRLFTFVGLGLFVGLVMYLVYLAIEPFVRKSWPTMLVGWSRAMGGRLRDAVIGRDLVVGAVAGTLLLALDQINALVPHLIGRPDPIPFRPDTGMLEHPRYFMVTMASSVNSGLQTALLGVLIFTILRELFKRLTARWKARWAGSDYTAAGFALAVATLIDVATTSSPNALTAAHAILTSLVFLAVLMRYGLLAVVVMYTTNSMLSRTPLTLRGDSLYVLPAWLMLGVIFAAAFAGVWLARGGEPLFGTADARNGPA